MSRDRYLLTRRNAFEELGKPRFSFIRPDSVRVRSTQYCTSSPFKQTGLRLVYLVRVSKTTAIDLPGDFSASTAIRVQSRIST